MIPVLKLVLRNTRITILEFGLIGIFLLTVFSYSIIPSDAVLEYDYKTRTPVELSISQEPKLGEQAEIVFRIFPSDFEWPKLGGAVVLPQSLELVDGELRKFIDWDPNETIEIRATVQAIKTGKWIIFAYDSSGIRHSLPVSILNENEMYEEEQLLLFPQLIIINNTSQQIEKHNDKLSESVLFHKNNTKTLQVVIHQSVHTGESPTYLTRQDRSDFHQHRTDYTDYINRNILEFLVFNNATIESENFDWIVAKVPSELISILAASPYIESIKCNISFNCGVVPLSEDITIVDDNLQTLKQISGTVSKHGCNQIDGIIVLNKTSNNFQKKSFCYHQGDYYEITTNENCEDNTSIILDKYSNIIYQFDTLCDIPNRVDNDNWVPVYFGIKNPFVNGDEGIFTKPTYCKDEYQPMLKNKEKITCVKPHATEKLEARNWGIEVDFSKKFLFYKVPEGLPKDMELGEGTFDNRIQFQTPDGEYHALYSLKNGMITKFEGHGHFKISYINNINEKFSVAIPKDLVKWRYPVIIIGSDDIEEYVESETESYKILEFDLPAGKNVIHIVGIL